VIRQSPPQISAEARIGSWVSRREHEDRSSDRHVAHLCDARTTVNRCLEKQCSTSVSHCLRSSISAAEPDSPSESEVAYCAGDRRGEGEGKIEG
jgi:hypothetical protein